MLELSKVNLISIFFLMFFVIDLCKFYTNFVIKKIYLVVFWLKQLTKITIQTYIFYTIFIKYIFNFY